VHEFYDAFATEYDTARFSKSYYQRISKIETGFVSERVQHGRVLEIGAGTGRITQILVQQCEEVLAVDISSKMLSILQDKIQSSKLITAKLDLFEIAMLKDYGKFDSVVAIRLLPHLQNISEALNIMRGAVHTSGSLIFDLWNSIGYISVGRKLLRRAGKVHTRFLTSRQMSKTISESQLEVVAARGWGYPRLPTYLLEKLGSTPFKYFAHAILFDCRMGRN